MIFGAEIIVAIVQIVVQGPSRLGAGAINLVVVARVSMLECLLSAADHQHVVDETVLTAGQIGVECRERSAVKPYRGGRCRGPLFRWRRLLRDRADGENREQQDRESLIPA